MKKCSCLAQAKNARRKSRRIRCNIRQFCTGLTRDVLIAKQLSSIMCLQEEKKEELARRSSYNRGS